MSIKIMPHILRGIVDPPKDIMHAVTSLNSAVLSEREYIIEDIPLCDELLKLIDDARASGTDIKILNNKKSPFQFSIHICGNHPVIRADIETNIYAAAPWLCCAALGCGITIRGINLQSNQTGIHFLNIMRNMGANFERKLYGMQISAPAQQGITIDASGFEDFIPFIGVLASFTHGITCITHTAHSRNEKRELLAETEIMLSCLGADAALINDSLMINGKNKLYGGIINTKADHRIVMAAAAAAFRCENEVILSHPECINEIYPAFWQDYKTLGGELFH